VEKREARRRIAEAVGRLSPAERAAKSAAVADRVLSLPETALARTVMAFLPLPDEIETRPLLAGLLAGEKRVWVPRTILSEHRMFPVRLRSIDSLRVGDYGIPEPAGDERGDPREIDFILVPGRAFDARGNRLGRGAGYYDRFLTTISGRTVLCGACFDCQVLDSVPMEETDLPVHLVVTESRVLRAGGR
jgi:5-formyltetrahydrofolate cyclo-ligase